MTKWFMMYILDNEYSDRQTHKKLGKKFSQAKVDDSITSSGRGRFRAWP